MTRAVLTSIRVSNNPLVYLVDTPGIMVPNISDMHVGLKLALCCKSQTLNVKLLKIQSKNWMSPAFSELSTASAGFVQLFVKSYGTDHRCNLGDVALRSTVPWHCKVWQRNTQAKANRILVAAVVLVLVHF